MSSAKLEEALNDCVINFDRRVLVTDLLEEYDLSYAEVNKTLEEHLSEQEKKGNKYEKRYLVQGEDESHNEVYTVVLGEAKLKEWLKKLKDAESSLYSVEVAGGAKAPARELKPVSRCAITLKNAGKREAIYKLGRVSTNAATAAEEIKPPVKVKQENAIQAAFAKKKEDNKESATSKNSKAEIKTQLPKKSSPEAKKTTPEAKKTTPEAKKPTPEDKKTQKKGINNFFAPATSKETKAQEKNNKSSDVTKPPTPKKMQDFFKKQADKPKAAEVKKQANTSVQLFENEDAETEKAISIESSDDEEQQLAALKRDIVISDNEDEEPTTSSKTKRRRIIDSDDEEDEPEQKIEKKEEDLNMETEENEPVPKSETYLDDDGFVITIKAKKQNVRKSKRSKTLTKTPTKAEPKSKKSPAPPSKTKQGNIMNFFTKK